MSESKTFLNCLVKTIYENKINHIFCSDSLIHIFDKSIKPSMTQANDVRGMTYMACGVSSTIKQPVVVIVNGDNESRNLFSGLTEAYYRNIPIIAIILSSKNKLDYTRILEDCAHKILTLSCNDSSDFIKKRVNEVCNSIFKVNLPIIINCLIGEDCNYSIHNNILSNCKNAILCIDRIINTDDYLFIAQDIMPTGIELKHKFHSNIGAYGNNGIISTTFGAALSNIHKRYYCILSYKDFINDINSLGNRHFPCNITIILLSEEKHTLISDYCRSLNIDYCSTNELNESYIENSKDSSRTFVIELIAF